MGRLTCKAAASPYSLGLKTTRNEHRRGELCLRPPSHCQISRTLLCYCPSAPFGAFHAVVRGTGTACHTCNFQKIHSLWWAKRYPHTVKAKERGKWEEGKDTTLTTSNNRGLQFIERRPQSADPTAAARPRLAFFLLPALRPAPAPAPGPLSLSAWMERRHQKQTAQHLHS